MIKINEHSFVKLYKISSGISTTKAQAGHGSPFVSFSTVFNNYFLPDELPDLMSTSAREQETYSVKEGDIFLTRTSETIDELAMSCVALKDYAKATFSGFTKRLRPITEGIVYHKYLGFYLRGYLFRQAVTNHSLMTLRSSFNEDIFALLKLYLPEYEQQVQVGDFLYTIEQKIQLNKRINAELEKVAKLLYDYWFVQFDFPNTEGKPYRQSGGEMVFSDVLKREIPKGWRIKQLHNVFNNITEYVFPGEHLKGLYYTPLVDIPMRKMSFYGGQTYKNANSSLMLYKENDILMGAMRVHFHRVCLTAHDGVTRSTTIVLRAKNPEHLLLLFQVANGDETIAYAKKLSGKSQQPYVNWDNELGDFKFALPPDDELILKYSNAIKPHIAQIKINERENFELTALRNLLLPLLMNGQVMVAKSETVATPSAAKVNDAEEKRKTVFKRLVLSAYILDTICDEPTAGRVKFEKLLYLSEHCAKIPLYSEFRRAAAGPYDSAALYGIESQLKKNKWFNRQKAKGESRAYVRLEKSSGYLSYLDTNFDDEQKSVIDKLLRLFKTQRTITCEIVATLYGAWNDFLLENVQPTDSQIVDEVMTNWHESKERIERKRWLKALEWMRQNDIVPTGYGASTKKPIR